MNDLNDLRAALHDESPTRLTDPDLTAAMAAGRRIRTRRRLVAAGSVAGAVIAVIVATSVPGLLRPPRDYPDTTAQALRPVPTGSQDGTVPDGCPRRLSSTDKAPPQPIGDVIGTGTYDRDGERVFFVECRLDGRQRNARLVVVSGVRLPNGVVQGSAATHGIGTDGMAMGRHQGVDVGDGHPVLPSGYYVGPAVRIVGTKGGASVTANQTTWSQDPDLVVWWFGPQSPTLPFDEIVAYDSNGAKLPDF